MKITDGKRQHCQTLRKTTGQGWRVQWNMQMAWWWKRLIKIPCASSNDYRDALQATYIPSAIFLSLPTCVGVCLSASTKFGVQHKQWERTDASHCYYFTSFHHRLYRLNKINSKKWSALTLPSISKFIYEQKLSSMKSGIPWIFFPRNPAGRRVATANKQDVNLSRRHHWPHPNLSDRTLM